MEGAKKEFLVFFFTYTRRKNATLLDFAAFLRQCRFLPFAAPFVSKFCANGAAKTSEVGARISGLK